jgi:hypothetical protein
MTSSRSILWTLAQPRTPYPSREVQEELADKLRRAVGVNPGPGSLSRAARTINADSLFAPDDSHERILQLAPPAAGIEAGAAHRFLSALRELDPTATPRNRAGRPAAAQRVSPAFVEAAISEWIRNGEDPEERLAALQDSDVLRRLGEQDILRKDAQEQLARFDLGSPPKIPADFCDDSKMGSDLGLDASLWGARKISYGVFGADFPATALDATYPENWRQMYPSFWRRSDVLATDPEEVDGYEYQAGLLVEMVNMPNVRGGFGPVALTFERATDPERTWSILTYQLADQGVMKANQGWFLVQRRPGRAHAAIMVKFVEFYGENAWLDSVCDAGMLDEVRTFLGIGRAAADRGGPEPARAGAASDQVLTRVLSDHLGDGLQEWGELGRNNVEAMQRGLAKFESKPWRFEWIDDVFDVVGNSTSFLSSSVSRWASTAQQKLPDALEQADAAGDDSRTTPAHLVSAGWKTALGMAKVGSDLTRAMVQFLGPGVGDDDVAVVNRIDELVRDGTVADFLEHHGVTEGIGPATQKVVHSARRARSGEELDADLDTIIRAHGGQPRTGDRWPFTREL